MQCNGDLFQNFYFAELIREMEEFEARTSQNHQVHKQLLSGKLAAIEEMAHKQRQDHGDSYPKESSQSLQVEKRDGEQKQLSNKQDTFLTKRLCDSRVFLPNTHKRHLGNMLK